MNPKITKLKLNDIKHHPPTQPGSTSAACAPWMLPVWCWRWGGGDVGLYLGGQPVPGGGSYVSS